MSQLQKLIREKTKKSFRAVIFDHKPCRNVANYGLNPGEMAIRFGQEYTNFSIKAVEPIRPLLTDYRIERAVGFIDKGDLTSAINILHLEPEVSKYGVDIIYSIIREWLIENEIQVPDTYNVSTLNLDPKLLYHIRNVRHNPLNGLIEIVDIGESKKGNSVVPENWMGQQFKNGDELHKAMDQLDWRKSKPPTTFCCIYSMRLKDTYKWTLKSNTTLIKTFIPLFILQIGTDSSQIITISNSKEYAKWLDTQNDSINLLPCKTKKMEKYMIACNLTNLVNLTPVYGSTDTVGLLVSRLQKSIRRGRSCSKLLAETINGLSKARPYNLPEQQYIKVSASRQLCWRLFITALEDGEPYQSSPNSAYYDLKDLLCLALLAQNDPDLQLNQIIVQKILYTALLIQHNDSPSIKWNWRFGQNQINLEDPLTQYIRVAICAMPMMSNDLKLLVKSANLLPSYKMNILPNLTMDELLSSHNTDAYNSCLYASIDMHCKPNIILQFQASLPFIPHNIKKHTTTQVASFIWEYSSKINVRTPNSVKSLNKETQTMLNTLYQVQKDEQVQAPDIKFDSTNKEDTRTGPLSPHEARLGFLLFFGIKVRLPKSIEVIVAGTPEEPFKIKQGDMFLQDNDSITKYVRKYIEYLDQTVVEVEVCSPPEGCIWKNNIGNKKKVRIQVKETNIGYKFMVNDIELKVFDASPILTKYVPLDEVDLPSSLTNLFKQATYLTECNDGWALNQQLRQLNSLRIQANNYIPYKLAHGIPSAVLKCLLAKLHTKPYKDNEIQVGPVDRHGKKLHDSVNYLYEGVLMRLLNLLSGIYPRVIQPTNNLTKFKIHRNYPEYLNLLRFVTQGSIQGPNKVIGQIVPQTKPRIKTILWEHQDKVSQRIYKDMTSCDKKGYGDASNVGTGKTLTAISVMTKLFDHHSNLNSWLYSGFLVLLPTTKLFKTWTDEIKKHTEGFEIIEQASNGQLSSGRITPKSIIITTLGRIRDKPLSHSWMLCIIDECLSVQNKDALQTEEAWKQILCSQYGVVMMSATFFRSRFDKLFYMLKMLRTGLPERREYLDTILSETIVCHLEKQTRKWETHINRFALSPNLQSKYDKIKLNSQQSSEQIYIQLNKLLFDEFNYIECFAKVILQVTKLKRRALIYTRSKNEADIINVRIKNVGRYPDISKTHTVLSYNEGTYGLNDLIVFDTIITRPPNGDALPQMKGRLDRPGNVNTTLYIEYILAEKTIDEAGLLKLELCNMFYQNYIVPLADYYKLAIGRGECNQTWVDYLTKRHEIEKQQEKICWTRIQSQIDRMRTLLRTK